MYFDFSRLFHESSKDLEGGGSVRIPSDAGLWPPEWRTVYYKTYPRFEKILLAHGQASADLYRILEQRRSARDFSGSPISMEDMSRLLKFSCGIVAESKNGFLRRAQPSGGGRFPLEIYPIVFVGSDDVPAGLYHYNLKEHALDVLWQRPFSEADMSQLFVYEWARKASCALIMTAVFRRNQMKYGERGYRYMLLEAGHIGQNVYLNAAAQGLKCCALGGARDRALEQLLDIDGVTESVVYSIALG